MEKFRGFFGFNKKEKEPVPGQGDEWEIGAEDLNPERISRQIADISQQLLNPNLDRGARIYLETQLKNLQDQQSKDLTGKTGY